MALGCYGGIEFGAGFRLLVPDTDGVVSGGCEDDIRGWKADSADLRRLLLARQRCQDCALSSHHRRGPLAEPRA